MEFCWEKDIDKNFQLKIYLEIKAAESIVLEKNCF